MALSELSTSAIVNSFKMKLLFFISPRTVIKKRECLIGQNY